MFCTKCGSKLEGEEKFCTQCGSPLGDAAPVDMSEPRELHMASNRREVRMWKYMLLEETDERKLVAKLNELGKENWEAVGYTIAMGAMGKGHHFVLLKQKPR